MKLVDGIETLELTGHFGARRMTIYPVLLRDADGATLVDTGMPGQLPELLAAIQAAGASISSLRRIVLTHQDIDHIGGARGLREASGASVLAHEAEAPYIQGEKPLLKFDPSRLDTMLSALPEAARAQARSVFSAPPSARVDRQLRDGDTIPGNTEIKVVHTPGHTPGHISLYVPRNRVLIAGDSLRVVDGELLGPAESNTADMKQAFVSVEKMAGLDVDYVVCYHGGAFGPDAGRRLQEIVAKDQA